MDAALAGASDRSPDSRGQRESAANLRNESDLFGVYVAAVRRALLASDNPAPSHVRRALHALSVCGELLQVSPSTGPYRTTSARLTLDVLAHLVTEPAASRCLQ